MASSFGAVRGQHNRCVRQFREAHRAQITFSRRQPHRTLTGAADIRLNPLNPEHFVNTPIQRRKFPFGRAGRNHKWMVALAVASLASACSTDSAIEPTGPKVTVCHRNGNGSVWSLADIFLSDLPEHKGHGDYVARLEVDRAGAPADDGFHFTRITDALAAARAGRIARGETDGAACRITIGVAPGTLSGSTAASSDPTFERFPLVIDVPDITLRGALRMQLDAQGRATGVADGGDVTTFTPRPALIVVAPGDVRQQGMSEPTIVVNAHPDGPNGHGAVIEGFVFQSGRAPTATPVGGQGIFAMRVRNIVVRGNRFEGGFTESVDLRASTGLVERNHLSGLGSSCDICIAGPGDYVVRDNRLLGPGGIPGVLSTSASILPVPEMVEQYTLPSAVLITAVMTNNEVRGHLFKPVGAGLRVGALGFGASSVIGTSKVTMTGNTLVGNTFGIIVEAAFPTANGSLRGDIDVTINGSTISQSCQNDLLVTFSRHANGLGLTSPFPAILRNSTYKLSLGSELPWGNAWYYHPAGYGNMLIVNGETMANGSRTAYDAARVCS